MDFVSTHNAREMYSRAGWTVGFAAIVYFINRAEYPGPALTLFVVLTLLGIVFGGLGYGLHWLATEGQRRVQQQLLDALQLQGGERILCLTHELGIEAAKRLKSGRVISLGDTASNEAAREIAKNAGLADRIRFEPGDPSAKLTYPDANFDAVMGEAPAASATAELKRVLKPGAIIVVQEVGQASSIRSWPDSILAPTSLPLGLGGRIVTARKTA